MKTNGKTQTLQEIPLNEITVKENYRKTFNESTLNDLAQSIKENGVIEPIIVRANGKGYAVIAGERRFRAAQIAKLATIPAIIRDVPDADALKIQLIENVQREGVPFMEEAYGLAKLRNDHDLNVSEICKIVGKSDAWVYQTLQLTKMAADAMRIAEAGWITKHCALLIARLPNEEYQVQAANALARTHKGKQVDIRYVRKYIESNFGGETTTRPKRNHIQKTNGNDFAANWKKYLIRFTALQFEYFKSVVKGLTDTQSLSEAVEQVMMEKG